MKKSKGLIVTTLILMGGTLLIINIVTGILVIRKGNSDFTAENRRLITVLSASLADTIQDYMGRNEIEELKAMIERQKGHLSEIEDIKIIRRSGIEAFKDKSTQKKVADQSETVEEKENNSFRIFNPDNADFQRAVSGERTDYIENGSLIQLMPIKKNETCDTCHSYDKNPVRGIVLIKSSMKTVNAALSSNRNEIIVLFLFSIAIMIVLLAYILKSKVIKPIEQVTESIKDIAEGEGDLTQRLTSPHEDEIGEMVRWFNVFIEKLQGMIKNIADDITAISRTMERLSETAKKTSEGSNTQSSSATQVATTMEEMSATILDIAKNTTSAVESSKNTVDAASKGGEIVQKTTKGMEDIALSVKKTSDVVTALGQSSDQIGRIISVIDDIADQTNLLALNAAIEAARAGEQGRGFAVVADEVRKLAERTTKATKEIAEMIKKIQHDTKEAVLDMNKATKEVESGVSLAREAGDALKSIISMTDNVSSMINAIATAAEEQSAASEEVSKNIEDISNVCKNTASYADSSFDGIKELSNMLNDLKTIISRFKLFSH
ncbi:MAG: HAMP domain-containing protein [Nitrospinae bacterium]|nr:HAMP domain-containing protein [Nitrospinota bacterium]